MDIQTQKTGTTVQNTRTLDIEEEFEGYTAGRADGCAVREKDGQTNDRLINR